MRLWQLEYSDYDDHSNMGIFTSKETAEAVMENYKNWWPDRASGYDVVEVIVDEFIEDAEPNKKVWWRVTKHGTVTLRFSTDKIDAKWVEPDVWGAYVYHHDRNEARKIGLAIIEQKRQEAQDLHRESEETWERHLKHQ